MSEQDDMDALLDCQPAFDALAAPRAEDAALLQRAIAATVDAGPGPGGGSTAAGGLPNALWLALAAGLIAVVAVVTWGRGDASTGRESAMGGAASFADSAPTDGAPAAGASAEGELGAAGPDEIASTVKARTDKSAANDDVSVQRLPSPKAAEPSVTIPPPPAEATSDSPRKPRAPPSLSAAQLLEQANQARRASEARRALALYDRLFRQYPRSREATTARVSAGRLYLDQGKGRAALKQFRKYLSAEPRGSLAEEAAAGQALALGKLGDTAAELNAWQTLLDKHPGSVHATRAKRRIAELDKP